MSRKTPTVDIFSRLSAVIKKTHDRAEKEKWFEEKPKGGKNDATKIEKMIAALDVRETQRKGIVELLNVVNPKIKIRQVVVDSLLSESARTRNDVLHTPMLVVVPVVNGNGHNYPLNLPSLILSGNHGLRMDGADFIMGNNHDWRRGHVRLATPAEIKLYVAELKKARTIHGDPASEFVRRYVEEAERA